MVLEHDGGWLYAASLPLYDLLVKVRIYQVPPLLHHILHCPHLLRLHSHTFMIYEFNTNVDLQLALTASKIAIICWPADVVSQQ